MVQKNKLRFWHTKDLNDKSTWRRVYPLGDKKYTWKKDKNEIFYRQEQSGGYVFSNFILDDGTKVDDFDFFIALDNDINERCETRYIVTERNCNGEWETLHIGRFTLNDGKFDLDRCTIEINQNIIDEYSCLLENKDEPFNILTVAPTVTTFSPQQNNYEFHSCRNKEFLEIAGFPCDGTGGWKKFYTKTATNPSQPRAVIYNSTSGADFYSPKITKDQAIWIRKKTLFFELNVYRYADNTLLTVGNLDVDSTFAIDGKLIAFTTDNKRTLKTYNPDTGTLNTIALNLSDDILWFDVEYSLDNGYVFWYRADGFIFAYDISTGITRIVDNVTVSQVSGAYQITYGNGLLAYHTTTNDLIRYNPQTFINKTIFTCSQVKHLHSEDGYLTWFDITQQHYYLQYRDDTTFEVILLRDVQADSKIYARENEWLAFDDNTTGATIVFNLINRESFSPVTLGTAPLPSNMVYKIENGWFLVAGEFKTKIAVYLDSNVSGTQYFLDLSGYGFKETSIFQISAGIERIYFYGEKTVGSTKELLEIDIKDGTSASVETLTNDLNGIAMNNYEQVITTNQDRVTLYKENIQRKDELTIWFRERKKTVCSGSSPTSPTGTWTLLQNQCNQFGTATWVRQPTASAPPAIDIVEGDCLCEDLENDLVDDKDECTSIDPNSSTVDLIIPINSVLNIGTIIGSNECKLGIGNIKATVTFFIENPRDGSTYTWGFTGVGATIISGQGTDVVVFEFTQPTTGNITCLETNPCHTGSPLPTINHSFRVYDWLTTASPTSSIPLEVEVDTFSGATVRFWRKFEQVWTSGSSQSIQGVTGLTTSIDNKNRVVYQATHDGNASSITINIFRDGASSNGTINIVTSPTLPTIETPNEVCPNGIQTFRIKHPKPNCQYVWSVDSPAFIVGSNTGESVQIDINGSPSGTQLHVDVICPVQPVNYQLVSPCDELHEDSWWWIIGDDIEYNRNRLLKNVVEEMVKSICPDITTIRSDFFQWNPKNPSLINYVYGDVNEYNYLTIAQKSDIRNPSSTEPATVGNLTWKMFAEWLRNMEIYYIIENNELIIEHISYFLGNTGLDLTQQPYKEYAEFRRKYEYAKFEMSKREEYKFMEAENIDFVGFPIEYKDQFGNYSKCVNEETESRDFQELTTDLKYIQTNAGDISRSGFVILANTFDGSNYKVIQKTGILEVVPILNSPLALSTIQERLLKHNRILNFGWMNRQFTLFESTQFFKKQEKFKIPLCCDTNFNPRDFIKTNLGLAEVEEAELDMENDTLELKLKYE